MKKTKIATSIAEAIVVLTIIVLWLTWVYNIYTKSMDLTIAVENKIQAIQIAREWIEAVTNIRDTNWLIFSSDPKNCWKTFNYDDWCVWEDDPLSLARQDIVTNLNTSSNFKVYKNADDRWVLEREPIAAAWAYSNEQYRNFYRVNKDSDWLYTQDWWNPFSPIYTRKIQITYINQNSNNPDTWTPFYNSSWETFEWLLVKSIVNWSSDWNISEIELQTILTNHKK